MKVKDPPGSTPLDDEALKGLIPNFTTQGELDEFEEANIAKALMWAKSSSSLKRDLISATGLIQLHKKMFDQTWKWAGEFRKRQTNIGVEPENIQDALGALFGDVNFWIANKTYPLDEIAIRFKHKLVWIHPFTNGNGRHSRLVADLFMEFHGQKTFSWGKDNLVTESPHRDRYIKTLQIADKTENYAELLNFAKS